ncbi:ATP-binding protein [Vibrio chagasii]|uniref:ATP-binding protein n=1 Tax=Vibrio chagasii TaxID=170679 RepID=UPI0037362C89
MSEFKIAVYTTSLNSDFEGNPFIECLPARMNINDFWDSLVLPAVVPDNFKNLDVETLENKAANIMSSVMPTSLYYDLYCDFLNILKEGYKERNPLDPDTIKWQNQVATETFIRGRTTAPSIKLTGYSGVGKTTALESILTTIPPVLVHLETGPMDQKTLQIVYIKINIPGEADAKTICSLIARNIDKVLSTNYEDQYKPLNRKDTIQKIITLCTTLLIGVIIFDEIHNICFSAPNERKLIFTLFDGLTQDARVPTVKIGTSKANRLAEKEFADGRRLGIPHDWNNFKATDKDWKMLLQYAWSYQLTPEFCELTPILEKQIYQLTQGIPHCLFFLIEQANKYCLRQGIPCFSQQVLSSVFDSKFSIMKPALVALRHGKLDAFDDLFVGGFTLAKDIQKLVKNVLKIADQQKLKGSAAKAVLDQIEQYLPDYKLTQKEERTLKRLEKESEIAPSEFGIDEHGYEVVPQ